MQRIFDYAKEKFNKLFFINNCILISNKSKKEKSLMPIVL
jgi:hypothetical protein